MTAFSDFIRNASPEEKERVYTEVMEKASARQMTPKHLQDAPRTLRATFKVQDPNDQKKQISVVYASFAVCLEREANQRVAPEGREWIPFKERLPGEENTSVLACYEDGSRNIYLRRLAIEYAAMTADPLTHWMPIPESPQQTPQAGS